VHTVPGGNEVLLYTTILGALGAFVPFTAREDVDFFQNLELHMRTHAPSLVGRDHLWYRSAYQPVKVRPRPPPKSTPTPTRTHTHIHSYAHIHTPHTRKLLFAVASLFFTRSFSLSSVSLSLPLSVCVRAGVCGRAAV
jgi:hypothetical protein